MNGPKPVTTSGLPVTIDVTQEIQETQSPIETQEIHRNTSPLPAGESFSVEDLRQIGRRKANADRAAWFAASLLKPLDEFIVIAYVYWRDDESGSEWETNLFKFVWLVRGHPDFRKMLQTPSRALAKVEAIIESWTRRRRLRKENPPPYGYTGDAWYEWFEVDRYDARAEFADVWLKSRYLPGQSPLQQAFDEARRVRLLVPDNKREVRALVPSSERCEKDYEFFVSLAGHLQVAVGDQPVKLPCENIGEVMGVSKMTISRYRRWAMEDGFLTETRAFKFRSKGRGDATEFRFDVEQYATLAKKASG